MGIWVQWEREKNPGSMTHSFDFAAKILAVQWHYLAFQLCVYDMTPSGYDRDDLEAGENYTGSVMMEDIWV